VSEGGDPTVEFRTPERTAAFPVVGSTLPSPSVLALGFLALAAGAFLVGIAVASTMQPEPAGSVVAAQQVGPSGGTVRFAGGELRIPSGALASRTKIVVRRTIVGQRVQVRPPRGAIVVFEPGKLVAYGFEPEDVRFRQPAMIIFRLSERASDGAVFARLEDTTLLLGGDFDPDRGTVSIEVRDLRFTKGEPAGP
jgi:hypothetical protein